VPVPGIPEHLIDIPTPFPSVLAVTAVGFLLGIRHATDPDHVIAVSTILSRHGSPVKAAIVGALWGLGHTFTILVVGAGIVLLGWVIPPRVGLSLELSVGVMLVVLGMVNIRAALREMNGVLGAGRATAHQHRPEDAPLARLDRLLDGMAPYDVLRPLIVGVIHGLAGSAAVALLVLAAIGNSLWSLAYLLVFGLGTIVGMMLFTVALALPLAGATPRFARLPRQLRLASGLLSLVVGLVIAYQIGVVDGLFGAEPRWTPH
jgi:sulfite exporter TauE/SafE